MKIFLWASIIWLLPFLFFVQKNEAKFKKNIVVGVTLPVVVEIEPDLNLTFQDALLIVEVPVMFNVELKATAFIIVAIIPIWSDFTLLISLLLLPLQKLPPPTTMES